MDYKIDKKDNELHVTLTVPPSRHNTPPQAWTTNDVLKHVVENSSHDVSAVVKAPPFGVRNHLGERHRTGTWVFSLQETKQKPEPEKAKAKKIQKKEPAARKKTTNKPETKEK